jgi:hypothetical protein
VVGGIVLVIGGEILIATNTWGAADSIAGWITGIDPSEFERPLPFRPRPQLEPEPEPGEWTKPWPEGHGGGADFGPIDVEPPEEGGSGQCYIQVYKDPAPGEPPDFVTETFSDTGYFQCMDIFQSYLRRYPNDNVYGEWNGIPLWP